MNENDSLVKGENLGGQFHYKVLDVAGPPMVHVTRNRLAEIVQFGAGQQLITPLAINAGAQILISSPGGDEISISKHTVDEGDQKRIVSKSLDEVIRAVVELGGTYPDVVQALTEAKSCGALASRFEVDALPDAGRSYDRVVKDKDGKSEDSEKDAKDKTNSEMASKPMSPAPDLFYQKTEKTSTIEGDDASKSDNKSDGDDDSDEKDNTKKGFFARMLGK
jgi:hypothetical protein